MRTILPARLQYQDYQFQVILPCGPWKWTTRVDVSRSTPVFQVRDVITPFGLLRDSIPIPGAAIQAMANSITELQQAFAPNILLDPTSLSFTVDEGRGFSDSLTVRITNDGVYGSLLGASVTSSAPYLVATPTSVGGLAFNESGVVGVSVDSTSLVASASPYSAQLTIQDAAASNTPQSIPVAVVVRPKAVISIPATPLQFNVTAPIGGGPFPLVPSQQFLLRNTGPAGSVLGYLVQKLTNCSPWLVSLSPTSGSLAGGASQAITVAVAPPASTLPGTYTETVRVSGYSSNSYQDIQVNLTVT